MFNVAKFRVFQAVLLVLMCSMALPAQISRPSSAGMATEVPVANFGGPVVALLNKAFRQYRTGQMEDALMTYDAILGQRPAWLPALVGKANVLGRLGRKTEADRYRQQALRLDPLATGLLMAKGRNTLLRYLALYPESVLSKLSVNDQDPADFSQMAYFDQQLRRIMNLPDSVSLSKTLRAKITGDRIESIQTLHQLMEDRVIDTDVGFMLEGNLDMLNHDYLAAIAAYNQAIDFHAAPWPEIRYNRGLAFILLDNYNNGCAELQKSAQQGFSPAINMLNSLCNF